MGEVNAEVDVRAAMKGRRQEEGGFIYVLYICTERVQSDFWSDTVCETVIENFQYKNISNCNYVKFCPIQCICICIVNYIKFTRYNVFVFVFVFVLLINI